MYSLGSCMFASAASLGRGNLAYSKTARDIGHTNIIPETIKIILTGL